MGQGVNHLAQPLPGNYLVSPPRADSNASLPVLAGCRGAKLLVPKEQPKAHLNPDAVRSLLDGRDVDVAARHNFSLRGEQTTFPVTWTIIVQSHGSIEVAHDEYELNNKIVELRPPFEFVDPDKVIPHTRMRPADREMADRVLDGSLDSELLTWAMAMFPLLDRDVCPNRSIEPRPTVILQNAEEVMENSQLHSCREWLTQHCEHVQNSRDASPFSAVKKAMKAALGNINESTFTALNLGARAKTRHRRGPQSDHFEYFNAPLPSDPTVAPIRLRSTAPPAP
jgi:hypothetical protein